MPTGGYGYMIMIMIMIMMISSHTSVTRDSELVQLEYQLQRQVGNRDSCLWQCGSGCQCR